MSILKIDASIFDALVLSHGHYDHFGGMVGFLLGNKSKLKESLPFFVGDEDCFCTRTTGNGAQYGSLDRKAIIDANLSLMMAEGPAIVRRPRLHYWENCTSQRGKAVTADQGEGRRHQRLRMLPDKVSPAKNTGTFIPDDFEHEIGTNFVAKGKGLVVLTSCSHRGVINTIRQRRPCLASRRCTKLLVASIWFRRSTILTSDRSSRF